MFTDPLLRPLALLWLAARWWAACLRGEQLRHWLRVLAAPPASAELDDPRHQRVRQAARRLHRNASKVVTR